MFPIELTSISFLALSIVALVLYHLIYSRGWRQGVMILMSLLLVVSFLKTPAQAIVLFGSILGGWLAARRLQKHPSSLLYWFCLLVLGGLFLMHKDVLFTGALGETDAFQPAAIMGFSLVFFKLIHLLTDANQGNLRPLRFSTYCHWILAFYTWLAGPIVRYNDFACQNEEGPLAPPRHEILSAFNRIVNGCIRLLIFCPIIKEYIGPEQITNAQGTWQLLGGAALYMYGYYLYIYQNFSGYCDVVIALGQLFGIRVPENFDCPWKERNLLDYWRHWHITLSEWFRDYIFTPIYVTISRKVGRKRWFWPLLAAYTVTFLGTGLWHGFTLNFLLFGLTHGIGCLFLRVVWQLMSKHCSKQFLARYKANRVMPVLGCLAMNTYVAFSLLFFSRPMPELNEVFHCLARGLCPALGL